MARRHRPASIFRPHPEGWRTRFVYALPIALMALLFGPGLLLLILGLTGESP